LKGGGGKKSRIISQDTLVKKREKNDGLLVWEKERKREREKKNQVASARHLLAGKKGKVKP